MLETKISNENSKKIINNMDSHSYIIIKSRNVISSLKDEENKFFFESRNCNKEESNHLYDSNFGNNDINNNPHNFYSHLNEENRSHHILETVPTEELFLKQKEKIKLYKERNSRNKNNKIFNKNNINFNINRNNSKPCDNNNDNNNLGNEKSKSHQKKIFNGTFKLLTLDNYQFFEKAYFQTKKKYSNKEDNIPILKNAEWKRCWPSPSNWTARS